MKKFKKYSQKYFDLKDTFWKITLKTNELSILDIRARTRIITILQKMRWKTTQKIATQENNETKKKSSEIKNTENNENSKKSEKEQNIRKKQHRKIVN